MPHIESSTFLPLPPQRVWELVHATGSARAEWDPLLARSRWTHRSTGPADGATLFVRTPRGVRMLLRFEHPHPYVQSSARMVKGPRSLASYGEGWRLHEEPEGTRLVWKIAFRLHRPLDAGPAGALLASRLRRLLDQRLASLARHARG
ncbi:MAG: SRPBCC family protein [Pseudoclavibacter sp.]|nr:SRPBCC family protein [Pseudoclavibacter sp.]